MTIAIDFDNTWTRDPEFWAETVKRGRERGIDFVMVTGRSGDGEYGNQVRSAVEPYCIPIVFAAMEWKRHAAIRSGWVPDIWIDDMPEYIGPQDALLVGPKIEASKGR